MQCNTINQVIQQQLISLHWPSISNLSATNWMQIGMMVRYKVLFNVAFSVKKME